MELTEEYIKKFELIGAGNFGSIYSDGTTVYKLYKKEIKGPYYNYHDNPSLNLWFYNKYKLNKLKSLSGKIDNCSLITDCIYIDGIFKGVASNYVEGDCLRKKVDELDVREKTIVSNKILSCVSELHKNNIYPLDFHLSNILVDDKLNVNIIDLDDALTKVRLISNPFIVRWSNLKLRDMIYEMFGEYDCYSSYEHKMSKFMDLKKTPKCSPNFTGIKDYLKYRNLPEKYLFISKNSDIKEIKSKALNDIIIIYVYDDDGFESYSKDILYFYNNGVIINGTVESDLKNVFMNNHNIVSCTDLSFSKSNHVLVKK